MEKTALEMLEEELSKPLSPPVKEEVITPLVDSFMDSTPAPLQDKPALPDLLQPFVYLYRMAVRKQMPDDRSASVIDAVEEAASVVLGELKGRIWQETLQERLAELREASDWFVSYWPYPLEIGEDPYACCD